MRKLLSMSLLFISTLFYAQQATDLPDFTPPSPEAAAITQYGNQEINESTGRMSSSIPLYTYKAGQITVPINLGYTGNGVKVNDLATWTGVNWILNAGGVITRTVYHRVDEYASNRIFQSDIAALTGFDGVTINNFFNSSNDQYDSEPDIFNFSFAGYSGSFYLNEEDMSPVLIDANSEISIIIEGNTNNTNKYNLTNYKEFKIITPDGSTYFFGGAETEESFMDQDWHNVITPQAVTSFYLYKAQHPINGTVFFEYADGGNYRIATHQNRTLKKYGFHPFLMNGAITNGECYVGSNNNSGNFKDGDIIYSKNEDTPIGINETIVFNNIRGGKFLSRIYSNNNTIEVVFNSSNTIDGGTNFERILDNIEVKNNTLILHKIDFNYSIDYAAVKAQRFFLDKIEINKNFGDDYKEYSFQYNNPLELPDRFSNSQDGMGYFNGKDNIGGLLPIFDLNTLPEEHKFDLNKIITGQFTADRNTHFTYKQKGTLERIYYPTGGYTNIEYESPYDRETTHNYLFRKTFINNYPIPEGNGATHNNIVSNSIYIGSLTQSQNGVDVNGNSINANHSLFESQIISINIELEATAQIGHHQKTYLKITDVLQNQVLYEPFIVMPDEGTNASVFIENRTFEFYFDKNKEYIIELILPDNLPSTTAMRGLLSLEYKTGYQLKEGEGLRVKRISDYTSNSALPNNIKRYYYTEARSVFIAPLEAKSTRNYVKPLYYKEVNLLSDSFELKLNLLTVPTICLVPIPIKTELSPAKGYLIDIYPVNNFYKQSILQNYPYVTISYGGDNFENGGVEKTFKQEIANNVFGENDINIITSSAADKLMSQYSKSWLRLSHNKLLEEKILKKTLDTLQKIQHTKYTYLDKTLQTQEVALGSIFVNHANSVYHYENAWLGNYRIDSKDNSISETQNISYIDAAPVAIDGQVPTSNPYTIDGWQTDDHDNDGQLNYQDQDYLNLIENYNYLTDETGYRKVVTTTNNEYESAYPGQPTKTVVTTSNSNKTYETINRYLDERTTVADNTNTEIDELANYNTLALEHRINSPIQTESYVNYNGTLTLLSKQKTIYESDANSNNNVLPRIIQTAKGNGILEDRIRLEKYDSNGNLTDVKQANGSTTKYIYNVLNQVTQKIENYIPPTNTNVFNDPNLPSLCDTVKQMYPNSQVTLYFYNITTNLLTEIIDPRCNKISYEYDAFYRLKYVKDQDGNILSKNEYNYNQN